MTRIHQHHVAGTLIFAALLLQLARLGAAAEGPTLAERLKPLIEAHRGKVAILVKHLDSGVSFEHQADEPMPTASLIKLMVMLEVYQQVAEGKLDLSETVELHDSDKVPGSGILTYHFSDGATMQFRDTVRLMIAYSDNTATNLVLDRVSIEAVNQRLADWDCAHTRINAKVFRRETSIDPEQSKKFGLGSTTARETVDLLARLHAGKLGDEESTKAMIEHLRRCEDKDKLRRRLPPGIPVAHKTGSLADIKTDAGIMYFRGGPVAVCVLTAQNEDRGYQTENEGNVFISHVGEQVFQHFAVPRSRP